MVSTALLLLSMLCCRLQAILEAAFLRVAGGRCEADLTAMTWGVQRAV